MAVDMSDLVRRVEALETEMRELRLSKETDVITRAQEKYPDLDVNTAVHLLLREKTVENVRNKYKRLFPAWVEGAVVVGKRDIYDVHKGKTYVLLDSVCPVLDWNGHEMTYPQVFARDEEGNEVSSGMEYFELST